MVGLSPERGDLAYASGKGWKDGPDETDGAFYGGPIDHDLADAGIR
jgi:hypothetical protein